MRSVLAIARAAFTEARRNNVTLIVVAFTAVMLLSTTFVLDMAIFTLERVATDFGLGVMSLLLVGLAVFLGSTQISREIDRRTIFLVLSRPVSRAEFIVGRALGTTLVLWALLGAMAAVFFVELWWLAVPLTQAMFATLVGLAVELMLLACIGAMFSAVTSPLVASLSTVGIYFIGHGATDLYEIAGRSKSPLVTALGQGLYWVLPQLDKLDFKLKATYELPIDWGEVARVSAYGAAYSVIAVVIAIAGFARIDFK